MGTGRAEFRFFGELNDFLKPADRGRWIVYCFDESPGIKDPIEALGVPHTEVELLLVCGHSADFSRRLAHGDRVTVYPRFRSLPVGRLARLRPSPPRAAFVLDVHLGKLARLLRLAGFDTVYRNDFRDRELVDIGAGEERIVLTRDRRLLFHRRIVHGHFVRGIRPLEQAREVIDYYELGQSMQPFHRCILCNGRVRRVDKRAVSHLLEPKTERYYHHFFQCCDCGQVYWRGSHMEGLLDTLQSLGATGGESDC